MQSAGEGLHGVLPGALLLPEPTRLDMLLALTTGLGWLAPDRGRLVLDNQRAGGWLRRSHWEQMSLLFSGWRDSTAWNDLRHTPGLVWKGSGATMRCWPAGACSACCSGWTAATGTVPATSLPP